MINCCMHLKIRTVFLTKDEFTFIKDAFTKDEFASILGMYLHEVL